MHSRRTSSKNPDPGPGLLMFSQRRSSTEHASADSGRISLTFFWTALLSMLGDRELFALLHHWGFRDASAGARLVVRSKEPQQNPLDGRRLISDFQAHCDTAGGILCCTLRWDPEALYVGTGASGDESAHVFLALWLLASYAGKHSCPHILPDSGYLFGAPGHHSALLVLGLMPPPG
eukprot:scaffold1659_cov371-Prasinococcus_capsulatus_cf.AAC.2